MILIIAGTHRPGSNTQKVAGTIHRHYLAAGQDAEIYSLAEMPADIFSPAAYATKPQAWLAVQQRVLDARGLHVVTPEYNGSFPGVLKHFIDMLKFPESFEKKPVAFVGNSAGVWGGLRAVEQLQMIFGYRNAYAFPERVFIPAVHTKLDDAGRLTDADLDARLSKQVVGFDAFISAVGGR